MLVNLKTIVFVAAQAVAQNGNQPEPSIEDQIWQAVSSWQAYTACALLAAGVVFAFYGWRISKVLAVINFSIIGGFLGHFLAGKLGINDLACTVGLAVVLGSLCIWQSRHGVSLLAGGAGGVLGAAIVHSLKPLLEGYNTWIIAGLLLGFVTFALLAFIIYKVAAVLYSSVQGSALVVAGALSLLATQASIADKLATALHDHIFLLPIMLGVPTIVSIVIQQMQLKRDPGWSIDA